MKASFFLQKPVIGIPITSAAYQFGKSSKKYLLDTVGQHNKCTTKSKQRSAISVFMRMNILGKKADSFAQGIWEHVRLGTKISDTVKGKIRLGARIVQVGGVEKVFMQLFRVSEGERLLKASQCYLSTTSGPIAGLLFISTEKIAFCSERSIKISSPNKKPIRIHYKVSIPLQKIKYIDQSENSKKPSQKYIELATVDNFGFWFMGFLNHKKAFKNLQQAISQD